MKTKILIILGVYLLLACKTQNKEIQSISIEELEVQLTKDIQIVDVRTPQEWKKGIIKEALKISVTSSDFEQKAVEMLDKSKPVYLYCRTEGRSFKAAEILFEKGYKAIYVTGGYNEWKNKIKK